MLSCVPGRGSRQPGKFQAWLTEQVQRRGRHLVLRQAEHLLKPTPRGFSKSVLSRKEGGEPPSALQLFALSRVLNVSADSMLGMIAADHGITLEALPAPEVLSAEADGLGRWFDDLSAKRRAAVLSTLGLDVDETVEAVRKETPDDQGARPGRRTARRHRRVS